MNGTNGRLKTWRWVAPFAALMLAMAFMAACGKPVNTMSPADPQAIPNVQEHNKVRYDRGLDKRVRVENIYRDEIGGLLAIQANVRNLKRGSFEFMYKFDWIDARGMEIYDPANPWTRSEIFGGQFTTLQAIAPSPKAVDWRLSIKAVKD